MYSPGVVDEKMISDEPLRLVTTALLTLTTNAPAAPWKRLSWSSVPKPGLPSLHVVWRLVRVHVAGVYTLDGSWYGCVEEGGARCDEAVKTALACNARSLVSIRSRCRECYCRTLHWRGCFRTIDEDGPSFHRAMGPSAGEQWHEQAWSQFA